ncbi:hypothetical protein [Ulvibacterium sp.]|uniref:hypothetical protein n=1 Tax=Ulvibacterium sp. TaxID=2665914 RepID=UPI003BAC0F52
MRKTLVSTVAFFGLTLFTLERVSAQTEEGSFLIEASTGFGFLNNVANTGFYLSSQDGETVFNIGAEGGYFIIDNLALKAGLGFGDNGFNSILSYKLGAKYYVIGQIPVAMDFTGASIQDVSENPIFLGIQGGYAIFLGDYIALEPGLRYNFTLNEDASDSFFQFNVGVAFLF